ncbi:MAG TPA: GTP cyclohydrolase I FolE [Lentisphaeria bacterium]|nr:MAG: GTP cyclohydrolase I FolE [Lentisphaerae bacterium GWF2_50_93]HCE45208.1 GTP cyclohydrolase I FolE [Lentisphaeria bacterium]
MKEQIRKILKAIGEDPDRPGLRHTPLRVEKSYQFLTNGYKQDVKKLINNAIYEEECNDMVIVKNIEFYSMCEHHMLPFYGKCHIGYIPDGKVFGVSKLARIVDCYARRLQLQERLTRQIANTILESICPEGVGVVMEAQHMCMRMRGVEKQESLMVTSAMLGSFRKEQSTRMEFLNLIRG